MDSDKENSSSQTSQLSNRSYVSQKSEVTIREFQEKTLQLEGFEKKDALQSDDIIMIADEIEDYNELDDEDNPQTDTFAHDAHDINKRLGLLGKSSTGFELNIDHFLQWIISCTDYEDGTSEGFWDAAGVIVGVDGLKEDWRPNLIVHRGRVKSDEYIMNYEHSFARNPLKNMLVKAKKDGNPIKKTIEEVIRDGPSTQKRRRGNKDDFGEDQHLKEGQTETNRDDKEQTELLKSILKHWRNKYRESDPKEQRTEEPIFYWELVMAEEFHETVENSFFVCFLAKFGVVRIFDCPNFEVIGVIPDYEAIRNSKFASTKDAKMRKLVKPDADLLEYTAGMHAVLDTQASALSERHRQVRDYESYGGHERGAPHVGLRLTREDHRVWLKYLKGRKTNQWKQILNNSKDDTEDSTTPGPSKSSRR